MIRALFDKWIFLLILLGALALWLATGLVFTQDEISALSRVHFGSFAELIEGGVKTDYHPALVQVFLVVWTAVFGTSEFTVKLPAILAGIGSLCIAFRLGSKIYDRATALILVSLVAFSQYFAFYFSIARPYAFGTLFVLLQINALYHWKKGSKSELAYIGTFILAAVFAAWTHYFALVAAGLVGLWGFLFLDRKQLGKYAASCLGALILFSPHLQLTLYHLSKEGIGGEGGWVSAPEVDVWWEYFFMLGQHTWIGIALVLGSFIQSLLVVHKMNSDQKRFMTLGVVLMFGLFGLAYFYSLYASPVFQYSILIFGAIPFLMAAIGGWVFSAQIVKRGLLVLAMAAGLYGLFITQAYPEKMRYQLYDDIAAQVGQVNEQGQSPAVLSIMQARFLAEYKSRKDLSYSYTEIGGHSLDELRRVIAEAEEGAVAQVNIPTELLYMVEDEFGGQIIERPAYELWRSDRKGTGRSSLRDTMSTGGMSYHDGEEFKEVLEVQLAGIENYPYVTIVLDVEVERAAFGEGVLVLELHSGEEQLVWRGRDAEESAITQPGGKHKIYHALRLQDVLREIEGHDDLLLSAYYWNKDKGAVDIGPIRLRVYPDMETRYGFFDKMPS